MKTILSALFFLVLMIISFVAAEAQSAYISPGQAAPIFSLPDSYGKTHKLSDYRGKYVVLEWFNPGCPFVRKHYQSGNMQRLQNECTHKGVVWLSICSSAPGKQGYYNSPAEYNRIFSQEGAAPTAILLDSDGKVGHLYDAKTTPDMFVINPQGTLIYAGAIDDIPGVELEETMAAKNYVETALNESMAGKPVSTPYTRSYGCTVKY